MLSPTELPGQRSVEGRPGYLAGQWTSNYLLELDAASSPVRSGSLGLL